MPTNAWFSAAIKPRTWTRLALLLLTMFFTCWMEEARADLKICNNAGMPFFSASLYPSGGTWISEGWWVIWPGDCTPVVHGSLDQRQYYTYTETYGQFYVWGGDIDFCAPNAAFKISQEQCKADNNLQRHKFKMVDVGEARDYSINPR